MISVNQRSRPRRMIATSSGSASRRVVCSGSGHSCMRVCQTRRWAPVRIPRPRVDRPAWRRWRPGPELGLAHAAQVERRVGLSSFSEPFHPLAQNDTNLIQFSEKSSSRPTRVFQRGFRARLALPRTKWPGKKRGPAAQAIPPCHPDAPVLFAHCGRNLHSVRDQ
jgi:hypothetical protein